MKISEAISTLKQLLKEVGDLEVVCAVDCCDEDHGIELHRGYNFTVVEPAYQVARGEKLSSLCVFMDETTTLVKPPHLKVIK